jgi:hypothetical protein
MWNMSSSSSRHRAALSRFALGAVAALAIAWGATSCTEVRVEETLVSWTTPVCGASNNGGGRTNGGGGSSQPPAPAPATTAVMDTYMVQIFELYDTPAQAGGTECETCIATRKNCFIERSSCVCGDPTPVDSTHMQEMLKGVRVGLPSSYQSQYCLRVMAVERTSQADSASCECDSTWEQPDRVRLCALSVPYAASSVPIRMDVQCSANTDKFSTCLNQ